jgi:hypothetical protein
MLAKFMPESHSKEHIEWEMFWEKVALVPYMLASGFEMANKSL